MDVKYSFAFLWVSTVLSFGQVQVKVQNCTGSSLLLQQSGGAYVIPTGSTELKLPLEVITLNSTNCQPVEIGTNWDHERLTIQVGMIGSELSVTVDNERTVEEGFWWGFQWAAVACVFGIIIRSVSMIGKQNPEL